MYYCIEQCAPWYACSREKLCDLLLHIKGGTFSAADNVECTVLCGCTCGRDKSCAPLLLMWWRRVLCSALHKQQRCGLYSASAQEAEKSTLLCSCTGHGEEHSTTRLHKQRRRIFYSRSSVIPLPACVAAQMAQSS